ncbi:BamA/TamA family outer membrane protein [Flaviaesturariibacter terrae]
MDVPQIIRRLTWILLLALALPAAAVAQPAQEGPRRAAADSALAGTRLSRFLNGRAYRREWSTPVSAPLFNSARFTVEKEGGGKQTKSLRLKDRQGGSWSLRSVQKFPAKALDPAFKKTAVERIVADGISGSYPYAALTANYLARHAGVMYLPDTLVYVAPDKRLGAFEKDFAGRVALLENRAPKQDLQGRSIPRLLSTEELVQELQGAHRNTVDQHAVLRARLLDNFLMDFDRHEGQWVWYPQDSAGRVIWRPIPKDRDQAFFTNDGLLPHLARSKSIAPELQGFGAKARNIRTFNRPARNFDRYFLTHLSWSDWNAAIDAFLGQMTDAVIDSALAQQPLEIRDFHGPEIAQKLKERRGYFKREMHAYYRFLSASVQLTGSREAESFTLQTTPSGGLQVVARDARDSGWLYERSFLPGETEEVQVYGLAGDDRFAVGDKRSHVQVRLIGGAGRDSFSAEGRARAKVYDLSIDQNVLQGDGLIHRLSVDPDKNLYLRLGYTYRTLGPAPVLEYSVDGGLFLGLTYKAVLNGFRKNPYGSRQQLGVARALQTNAYHAFYRGEWIGVLPHTDAQISFDGRWPTVRTRFYGYGNETTLRDPAPGDDHFYLALYTSVVAGVSARYHVSPSVTLSAGPYFQYFKGSRRRNDGKLVGETAAAENVRFFDPSRYLGARLGFEVDTRSDRKRPKRGVLASATVTPLWGFGGGDGDPVRAGGHFAIYHELLSKKLVAAIDLGGEHLWGKFVLPQAATLGLNQNLRGFRYQRFSGRSRVYGNAELRAELGTLNAYLFRGPVGLLAFEDAGRVWSDGEQSDVLHTGYGGGLWIAPFNKALIVFSMAFSKEERALPLLTFGYQF